MGPTSVFRSGSVACCGLSLARADWRSHHAHRIEMRGESMRKKRNPPQNEKKE
jgi:hypothetical protein